MMHILETVWRTVPWAHAVHYCEGDVLVVIRRWRWVGIDEEYVYSLVKRALGPDVAVKVIFV